MKRILILAVVLIGLVGPWSLADTPPAGPVEPVVVRLYFPDRTHLNAVAGELDLWEAHPDQGYAVAAVSPDQFRWLQDLGYRLEIVPELTALLNRRNEPLPGQGPDTIPGYPCYRTVEETYQTLQTLSTTYPSLTELEDIGDSWDKVTPGGNDGYDIYALRITNEEITPLDSKPTFFLMAEIHSREYTTAETATRFAEYLLQNYGTDPEITFFVDHHRIYIVPMTNPDGRKIAEGGVLWRKNVDNDDGCADPNSWGTDLNRNHSFKWGCCGGSSGNPCAETYRGPSAASEPETQAIQSKVLSLFPDQRGPGDTDPAPADATGLLITLHSYSELVLWPWGWTSTDAPNGAQLQTLGRKLAWYNNYTPQQSNDLYTTDGTTDDWSYGELGIASYTFELGTQFFQACTTFENTIWPTNRPALLYAFMVADTPYMTAYGPDALNGAVDLPSVPQGQPVQLTARLDDSRRRYDPAQNIVAAEYFVLPLHGPTPPGDPGTGIPMSPQDGSWNSSIEDVVATVDTSGLAPGSYIIALRGQDAGNNWGPFTAVFLTTTLSAVPDLLGLEAAPTSIPIVYGQATVTATLTLSDGTPTPGWPVTFTTDLGTLDPVMAYSDENGQVVTTLSAGATAGTAHVSAEAASLVGGPVEVAIYTPAAPTAGFTANSPVCVNTPVAFTNLSTYPPEVPVEYLWDFGDGVGSSTAENPTYTYATGGEFTVILTAGNVGGTDTVTHTVSITPTPTAIFTYSPAYPQPGQIIHFYDASSSNPIAWSWNFGDGSGSFLQNPLHLYTTAGTYTVTLKARNGCGWGAEYSQAITVAAELPRFYIYLPLVRR